MALKHTTKYIFLTNILNQTPTLTVFDETESQHRRVFSTPIFQLLICSTVARTQSSFSKEYHC